MKKILFNGCGTAISTPFDENGVNLKEFQKIVTPYYNKCTQNGLIDTLY